MSKQDFDAFINRATQNQDEPIIDWDKKRDEMLRVAPLGVKCL